MNPTYEVHIWGYKEVENTIRSKIFETPTEKIKLYGDFLGSISGGNNNLNKNLRDNIAVATRLTKNVSPTAFFSHKSFSDFGAMGTWTVFAVVAAGGSSMLGSRASAAW